MGVDTAFCLTIAGVLLIYCEMARPGRIVPGIVGAAALVTGGYSLWSAGPAKLALELIAAAAALFLLDVFVNSFFVAATAGSMALALGFCKLGITQSLAVPGSILIGAVTVWLNYGARRARWNKRVDLNVAGDR